MNLLSPNVLSAYECRLTPAEVNALATAIRDILQRPLHAVGKQIVYIVKETDFASDEESYRIGIGSINAKSYTVKTLEDAAARIAALVSLES